MLMLSRCLIYSLRKPENTQKFIIAKIGSNYGENNSNFRRVIPYFDPKYALMHI
jgi:hypothetical protein